MSYRTCISILPILYGLYISRMGVGRTPPGYTYIDSDPKTLIGSMKLSKYIDASPIKGPCVILQYTVSITASMYYIQCMFQDPSTIN